MSTKQLPLLASEALRAPFTRSRSSRLDESTRQIGRQGVAAARAALQLARRPDCEDSKQIDRAA